MDSPPLPSPPMIYSLRLVLLLLPFWFLTVAPAPADDRVDRLIDEYGRMVDDSCVALEAREKLDRAKELAESLYQLGISRNDRDLQIRGRVRFLYAGVRYGQWDDDWELLLQECSDALTSDNTVMKAEVLMYRGRLKGKWLGDLEGGIDDLHESIYIANRLRNDRLTGIAYAHCSELLVFANSYNRAREYAFRAVEIAERVGWGPLSTYSLYRIVGVLSIMRESENAAPYARRLLELNPDSLAARSILYKAGEYPDFDRYLVKQLAEIEERDPRQVTRGASAHVQILLAEVRCDQKQYAEALKLASLAREGFAKVGNWIEARIAEYTIALIRLQLGEEVDIAALIKVVEDQDTQLRFVYSAEKVARLYEAAGEFETAWQWHQRSEKNVALEQAVGAREARKMAREFWDSEMRTRAEVDRLLKRQQQAQLVFFEIAILGVIVLGIAVIARMRFRMIRQSRDELESQVAERTASLDAARLKAETANAAKSEFLARINHEIRNPLTAILGYCELMELQAKLPGKSPSNEQYLSKLRSSSEHLMDLVTDVLEVSRIERGRTVAKPELFDLHEFCADMRELFFERSRQSGVEFICQVSGRSEATIYADRSFCSQILVNLISNAFDATQEGRVQVEFSVSQVKSGNSVLSIEVCDTGKGIAESDQERIFEPFVQLPPVTNKGHGLGLHATQSLVSKMGGVLELKSELGVGTKVSVSIPSAKRLSTSQLRDSADGVPCPLRVLVIDDLQEVCEVLSAQLKTLGFIVRTCDQLEEILKWVANWKPDIILLDLRMPKYSGYEILEAIRREDPNGSPVIAMTGDGTDVVREKALQSGFDGFVAKPFSIAKITQTIQDCLGKSQTLSQ